MAPRPLGAAHPSVECQDGSSFLRAWARRPADDGHVVYASRGRAMPSEVRFAEVRRLVERAGWVLVRIRGSHHVFKRPKGMIYVIPVHHGMVKYAYVREI